MLIVDDEVENLDAFTLNFGRKFLLRTASSGAQALEIAKSENIAVVIADQRMPLMSGTQFLAEFKKVRPDAVRMILTGYTDLESVISAINQGEIHRYVTKPWEAREIEAVLRNSIDHYRRGMEHKRRLRELNAYNRVLQLIASGRSLSRIVKEVLELIAMEFGFARTFLLLGDPSSDQMMRGQVVLREKGGRPEVQKISASARAPHSNLAQVVSATTGFSAEKFRFSATLPAAGAGDSDTPLEIEFNCGPFYGAPLVVEGRVVGMLCADRAAGGRDRTDREDARFIMTLATQIAVATGGHLTAENLQRKGGGKDVETSRPSKDPTRLASPPRRAVAPRKIDYKNFPILLVDDDRGTLDTFLLNFGNAFTVVTAGSPAEALDVLETRRIAVIVTDQRMPKRPDDDSPFAGFSGIELLAEAQDRVPDCVRMVLTGYSDIEEIIGAVNRGLVYRYINKPWEARDLGSAIREAIEYHHELVESRRLLREAEVVNRLMTIVAGEADADRIADTALRIATTELGYDRAYLFHYDEPTGNLVRGRSAAREGQAPSVERLKIPVIQGGGLLANVMLSGAPARSTDGPHQAGGVEIPSPDRKATLAVPLGSRNPLGVLAAESSKSSRIDFGPSDELTLETLAEVVAISIKHAQRLAELKAIETVERKGGAT